MFLVTETFSFNSLFRLFMNWTINNNLHLSMLFRIIFLRKFNKFCANEIYLHIHPYTYINYSMVINYYCLTWWKNGWIALWDISLILFHLLYLCVTIPSHYIHLKSEMINHFNQNTLLSKVQFFLYFVVFRNFLGKFQKMWNVTTSFNLHMISYRKNICNYKTT